MSGSRSVITGVSVSHVDASVDEIERVSGDSEREMVRDLLTREGVDEAFALRTCNRAEAYIVSDDAAVGRRALRDFAPDVRDGAVTDLDHEAAIRHLMRVATGLESLVVGEDQILGQFRTAIEEARSVGGIGPMLDEALTKALHVGERARTETAINEGVVSLGSAAVRLAERHLDLTESTAVVVGAGEMGLLTARALDAAGIGRLLVVNRTVPHAEHVARDVTCEASAVALDALPAAVGAAELVVSATASPDYVLDDATLSGAGETLLIDIAQPRDIDPAVASLAAVTVHDIDALESVTEETHDKRQAAAERVEEMIDDEFTHLMERFKRARADEAIGAMYESAERVKQREVETALRKLESQGELTDDQRETVGALADTIVNQLLAAPTKSLREAAAEDDWTTIQTAMQLFDPEFGGERPTLPTGEMPDGVAEDADVPPHVVDRLSDD
ncbi:glutamyl-tRNA reductase [Salinigranum halophilum]|uniref:glutamyl-tRNA reductase n=1 Tax=Salinigranum halophilum TaxID=2565931 RepID=UPI0010A7B2DE|nr:glutamyl-tRNA reductase [Salinigranum halophilum]